LSPHVGFVGSHARLDREDDSENRQSPATRLHARHMAVTLPQLSDSIRPARRAC